MRQRQSSGIRLATHTSSQGVLLLVSTSNGQYSDADEGREGSSSSHRFETVKGGVCGKEMPLRSGTGFQGFGCQDNAVTKRVMQVDFVMQPSRNDYRFSKGLRFDA